ncbi:Transmembrane protein 97 predicted [Euphorbia peplus]|nr:Transmembrane protein 97 predicted [Euphorbia peplus]
MGAVTSAIDGVLFLFFLFIAVAAPAIDAQTCLPLHLFPNFLVDLKNRYANSYGDYLVSDKPNFFVGIVWLELIFQWPLALLNLYAILSSKRWYSTSCLIYGASVTTSMVAIIAELKGSGKASEKLLMIYYPFLGLGLSAMLRGLMPNCDDPALPKRHVLPRKKRV